MTMRVRDVMTYGALGVSDSTSLTEAVETLLRARVSALLVFDSHHVLVGILSEGDLLRRAELGTDRKRAHWLESLLSGGRLAQSYARTHGRRAGEVMTAHVVTIDENADVSIAVDLMLKKNVKRLPVLRGEEVVGVVSRSDVLKALLAALPKDRAPHTDPEIKAEIQEELDKLAWAPRSSVDVDVAHGVVTFTGAITDERMRSGLKVIAENIPGVTEVHDQMCWIEPNSGVYLQPGA